ncbi:cytochrome P450, partial [Mycena leptocephala]
KYVPEWVPGAAFKRNARKWKELIRSAVNAPFTEVKRKIAAGTARQSFVSDALGKSDCEDPEYEEFQEMVKSAAASMYSASVDPMVSTLGTFILAMLTNPEAQRKAQCEIDAVVGRDRLPQFEDMELLPY